jgi:hypothetical protein
MSKNTSGTRRGSTRKRKGQRRSPQHINKAALLGLWNWLLGKRNLLAGHTRHGNTRWTARQLVIQAICWSWSAQRYLTDAFAQSVRWTEDLCGTAALTSYQGFMGALGIWSSALLCELRALLHQRLEELDSRFFRVGLWVLIAFDGSRTTTPRTPANERAFCAPNHGRGKTAQYRKKKTKGMRRTNNQKNKPQPPVPQVWITLLWHVGLRLAWTWRRGPSNASERDHVMDMAAHESFPPNTLFCGDAGFIGYPLWAQILGGGHHFLVRAGANVHLLVRGRVGHGRDQQVLSWPQHAQRQGLPALRLRLIRVRLKKTRVWLLTSVLDPNQLSRAQASSLYQMRWGVEVEFRGLKQTLSRAKLRCHNDQRALVELDWSVLGLLVSQLWALKEQLARRQTKEATKPPSPSVCQEYDPKKRSLAGTMRALRESLEDLGRSDEPGVSVAERLSQALTDDYVRTRSKQARYRPTNPDKKPLGDPKIRRLKSPEQQRLDTFAHLAA